MRVFNWDSFDSQFPSNPIFWYTGFEELGFEFVFQTGSLEVIMIKKGESEYLLKNLGGGFFTVNDSVAVFTGEQLYMYLKQLGAGDILNSIKTRIQAMPNRFKILSDLMECIA